MPALNGFEKHVQTAIQVIMVGIILWVGTAIISLRDSSIRLEEKQGQMRESLHDLKVELAALRVLVTASAERQSDLVYRMRQAEQRLDDLEQSRSRSRSQPKAATQ